MGLYLIKCPTCGKEHMWWSDNLDQRCAECKATDGKRNKRNIFEPVDFELCKGELTEERMTQRAAHLANNRLASLGIDAETPEKVAEAVRLMAFTEKRILELTSIISHYEEGSAEWEDRAITAEGRLAELERQIAEAPEVMIDQDSDIWVPEPEHPKLKGKRIRARLVQIEVLTK